MALEVGTPLKLDVGPALQAIDRITAADSTFRAEQAKTSASVTTSYAEMARQATAYSDNLKRQQDEVRAAATATRSATEEVRRLTSANQELAAASKKANNADEVKRLQGEIAKNTARIKEAKQAILENRAATDQERQAVEAVREARRQEVNQTKLVAAGARDAASAAKQEAAAAKEAASAAKESGQATESASKGGGLLSGVLSKAGAAFAGLFAVEKIVEVGEEIRRVTAEFEKYEITLTGAFNGDQGRAQRALIQVRNFADANGLEISALTDTYVKLVNRGIIPTTQQLRQLSDIAATSGKNTDQFVEALLDAQTGEFERLKEFGIKVKNNGDTISFSFRGVKTEVKNTQDAISQYLFALGDAQGVQGQAAAQLKSLGGAAADSKNAFMELFQVIGERSKSVFGGLSNATAGAARALANYFKSSDQIALEQSASGIDRYAQLIGAKFTQIATDTKAKGGDVSEALKQAADDQTKFIDSKLAKAKRDLADYYKSAQEASAAGGGEVDAIDPNQVARLQTAIKLYEGQREAAKRAYQTSFEGASAEADAIGRIAALRAKIAAEEKARDAAPDTNAGNQERVRLVKQLIADNKELNELLGKQDKASQAAADKLGAALRALYAERVTLQGLAAKASIKDSDDQAARAKLAFDESLRQTEILRQKLVEREAAVRKAGGRGANADGVIDGEQEKELGKLRASAMDTYYSELLKITEAREQRLFDLRADSNQKEIESIDRKYDKLIAAAKDNIERQALEEARAREQTLLRAAQEQKRIDQVAQAGQAQAGLIGQTFGAGTGVSQFEAARAEAQMLLDIEKQSAQDSLNNTLNKTGKAAEIERAALEAQLARVAQQQKKLNIQETLGKFSIYKLILGENDSEETRAALDKVASTVVTSLQEITAAEEQAAAQRVAVSNQVITELTGQLAAQIQLNESGSASNIKGLQEQIEAEKQARRQAIDDQRKAAKEKVLIDTLTQASSIATAAAEVFATFAPIPFVGIPLGIAAAALLVGAFTAAKVQAYQAAGSTGAGFFKGGYTGGEDEREERGVVHGKEFVHTAEKTAKYRSLFEALHTDKPQAIDWQLPEMRALLPQDAAGLLPDLELPGRLKEEKRLHVEHTMKVSNEPLQAELSAIRAELAEIKASNSRMADQPARVPLGPRTYVEVSENGSTHVKNL